MAAYEAHLRQIHNNEAFYGGLKPQPKAFTTDRDVLDLNHKFVRDDVDTEPSDPLVKEYYEGLIKDCVLVDLSRYKDKQVAMRWRTLEEVKAGKGTNICANVSCERTGELEVMEVVFRYEEEGKRKDILVKCVLCQKCAQKMRKVRGKDQSRTQQKHEVDAKEEPNAQKVPKHRQDNSQGTEYRSKRRREEPEGHTKTSSQRADGPENDTEDAYHTKPPESSHKPRHRHRHRHLHHH